MDWTTELVKFVGAITAPILATLLTAYLWKLLQRIGVTLDAEKQAKVEYYVRQGILRAEEWGAARLKAQIPTTAADKLTHALTDVVAKVPGITREEAAALIEAELPKVGLGAAAFFAQARKAVES